MNSLCKISNTPDKINLQIQKNPQMFFPAQNREILLATTRSTVLSITNHRNLNIYNMRSNNMYENIEVVPPKCVQVQVC